MAWIECQAVADPAGELVRFSHIRAIGDRAGAAQIQHMSDLDPVTGRPAWKAYRSPTVPTDMLKADVSADVLVVGMGIAGAMIVESLSAAGFNVIAIDRRAPVQVPTPEATALVLYEMDEPLRVLTHRAGHHYADAAWRRSRIAVANLSARVAALEIECGLTVSDSLLLAGTDLDADGLRHEAALRRTAGLFAEFITPQQLRARFNIARDGAILSPANIAVDPRKLAGGLLTKSLERGAHFYAPVGVADVQSAPGQVTVETAGGPVITAQHVVFTTGHDLPGIVPRGRHTITSSWAIATRPQEHALWPEQLFIWEASHPYLYLRSTSDGRVVCGGEDEPIADDAARDALMGAKSATLARKLAALMPGLDTTPEFVWAGSYGSTSTGLPLIGKVPGHPNVFAVMGYGGNGMIYSKIAAEIVLADMRGMPDKDAGLFGFRPAAPHG